MANREAEGYVQQTPEIVQFSLRKGGHFAILSRSRHPLPPKLSRKEEGQKRLEILFTDVLYKTVKTYPFLIFLFLKEDITCLCTRARW